MDGFEHLGKLLLILGGTIAFLGLILLLVGRVPGLGRLPGDIVIQRPGFTCVAPIVTMLIVSIVLTIVVNIVIRLLER